MTHPADPHGAHGHAHAPAPSQTPFTPQEWDELHAQDRSAARAVCGLMLGIFVVGVVLYTIVAMSVGS